MLDRDSLVLGQSGSPSFLETKGNGKLREPKGCNTSAAALCSNLPERLDRRGALPRNCQSTICLLPSIFQLQRTIFLPVHHANARAPSDLATLSATVEAFLMDPHFPPFAFPLNAGTLVKTHYPWQSANVCRDSCRYNVHKVVCRTLRVTPDCCRTKRSAGPPKLSRQGPSRASALLAGRPVPSPQCLLIRELDPGCRVCFCMPLLLGEFAKCCAQGKRQHLQLPTLPGTVDCFPTPSLLLPDLEIRTLVLLLAHVHNKKTEL